MLSSTPVPVCVPLSIPLEQLEAIIYQGYSYAVDADKGVAVITSPRADED